MNPEPLEICLDKVAGNEFFDEIRVGRFTRISFHRTLRIPEDGRDYPLPAGLGRFPIHRVEDYAEKVPAKWLEDGGFFIPLYQKEALYLQFDGAEWHPNIAKVCVGQINAITGKSYSEELSRNQQDYIVIPNQKWLDGICSGEGLVKQFVAMPLGQGYTIEEQITDEAKFGGIQLLVFPAVSGRFPERDPSIDESVRRQQEERRTGCITLYQEAEMGIAAGGSIKQQIQRDTYGIESWSPRKKRNLKIYLVNSIVYKAITGLEPPDTPITVEAYQRAKIPWYSHYDETAPALKPPSIFKRIFGVAAIDKKRGLSQFDDRIAPFSKFEIINRIKTPDKSEASRMYRKRANASLEAERWENAIREISYVIDLDADVCADDYAIRSRCNYSIEKYQEGSIDATLGLYLDPGCVDALLCRAYCFYAMDAYDELMSDADSLIQIPETKLDGIELKAEAFLFAGRYDDALHQAETLISLHPENQRAKEIRDEAKLNLYL